MLTRKMIVLTVRMSQKPKIRLTVILVKVVQMMMMGRLVIKQKRICEKGREKINEKKLNLSSKKKSKK
jgi:hypothetical protein